MTRFVADVLGSERARASGFGVSTGLADEMAIPGPRSLVPARPGLASWVLLDLLAALPRPWGGTQADAAATRLQQRVEMLHAAGPVAARRALFTAAAATHAWRRVNHLAAQTGYDDPSPDAWQATRPALLTPLNLAELSDLDPPARPWLRRGRPPWRVIAARCDALAATPTVIAEVSYEYGTRPASLPTLLPWPHATLPPDQGIRRRAVAAVPAALAVAARVPHTLAPAGTDPARLLPTVAALMAGGPGPVGDVTAATAAAVKLR